MSAYLPAALPRDGGRGPLATVEVLLWGQVVPTEHEFAEIRPAYRFRRRVLRWCRVQAIVLTYRGPRGAR